MNIDKYCRPSRKATDDLSGIIKLVLVFLMLIVFLGVIFFLTPFKQVV